MADAAPQAAAVASRAGHRRALSLAAGLLPRARSSSSSRSRCRRPRSRMPPYTPVLRSRRDGIGGMLDGLGTRPSTTTSGSTEDALYFNAYLSSVIDRRRSRPSLTLLIGYPIAYGMARAPASHRGRSLVMLVILPFWTSFLIRVYAWIGILKPEGLLNQLLLWPRRHRPAADHHQHQLRRSSSASSIPTCRSWCCRSMRRWRRWTTRCSRRPPDLGSPPIAGLLEDHLPAVAAGRHRRLRCWSSSRPSASSSSPICSAARETLMIGKTLWNEFFANRDWPVASAVAVILLLLLVVPIVIFQNAQARARERGR